MSNVKDDFISEFMSLCIGRFNGDDLKFIKEKFWMVAYNYTMSKITSTDISVCDGSTTERLFDYFRIGKLSSGKSVQTIEQYRRVVYQLCDYCHKELNMLTTDDILSFMVRYKKINNIKDSTMDCKRKYLASVFGYLTKHKKIAENPMDLIEPVKYKKCIKKPLSDEEIELLKINCRRSRDIAILQLSLDTGVRVSELCGINLSDIDFHNYTCKVTGKGNKERIVPFSGKTMMRINEYLKHREDILFNGTMLQYSDDTPLFLSVRGGKRIQKSSVESMLHTIGKRSGVLRVHPHLLRATCATRLAERDTDIGIIAMMLGHSNLQSVTRYVLIGQQKVEQTIRQKGFCS